MPAKKTVFRIILIIIPFLILFLTEIILRLAGYGGNPSVVAQTDFNGKPYYTMNQLVGKRYFNKDRLYFRKGSHDFFEVDKKPNTIRVFCFGASTTAGFPYEYNAIPSEFLRQRLVEAFPGKNIEVINTAIAATNSFTVAEFAKELADYQPDLYIVYMGQNEFYGAFGVGSTISFGKSRWMIKSYLWLLRFKTFLLLRNGINAAEGLFGGNKNEKDKLLMEEMVSNNSIALDNDDFMTAENTFLKNYEEIIETAQGKNIPVIISTLVTNEKDLPPFVSIHSSSITAVEKAQWKNFYQAGMAQFNSNNFTAALDYFNKAMSIDESPADVHYYAAKCYQQLNKIPEASVQYRTAKDLDGLRFRAPSVFNEIIRGLSSRYKVPLADVNKIFRENSPDEIPGKELLIDHLHPNIKGYFLLARSWFNTIANNHYLQLSSQINLDDSLLWEKSPVTELDSLIGHVRIEELKSRPPFSNVIKRIEYNPKDNNERIAYQYITGHKLSWGQAHMMAASTYINSEEYAKAIKEYRAVLVSDENNPNVITLIGDMYYDLELYEKAEENYLKALDINGDVYLRYKLGLTEVFLKKPEVALDYLRNCLYMPNIPRFNQDEIQDIHYYLALAHQQLGDKNTAINEVKSVLQMNPKYNGANELLRELGPKNK